MDRCVSKRKRGYALRSAVTHHYAVRLRRWRAAWIPALDLLAENNVGLNYCRVRAFPFTDAVREFIDQHDVVYVVEQNRDAQLRTLLITDIDADQRKLVSVLHYDGMPMHASFVVDRVLEEIARGRAA